MSDAPLRVFIADDHALLRNVITIALERLDGVEVVGQADNGRTAVQQVLLAKPDVVLMDILMPLLDGLEATRRIRRECPSTRVLILTGMVASESVLELLRTGATGIVPKTSDLTELETAVRAVARGEIYVTPSIAGPVLGEVASTPVQAAPNGPETLSGREREVMQLVGEGQSTRDIAAGLVISPKTVAQHKANIIHKLKLGNTRDLQLFAARAQAQQLRQPSF